MALLLFAFLQINAQAPVNSYTIKNGKMYIAVGKNIQKASLDSFVVKYELADLDLQTCISTGSTDTLKKLGWKIDIDNKELFVISKPLFSADNVNNVADKIIFTQKGSEPVPMAQVHFGYNRFRNKTPFGVVDSTVRFFLRGNTNARKVMLAGSFTDWVNGALPMIKTDSGWMANAKLAPGKYLYKFVIDGNWTLDRDNANVENDGLGNDNSVYYKTNHTFGLEGYTNAKRVYIAGSFNQWKERNLLMLHTATGWELPVYLSEGTHTYRFIIDGKWLTDPANKDKLPNEYNEYNSVIRIGKPYIFKLSGYLDAAKVVLLGSFNNWKDNELFMNKTETGWELPYTIGPGNYEYRLKIDGKQTADSITKNNLVLVVSPNFTFRLKGYGNSRTVCVSGDLNSWNPVSFRMKKEGDEWIFKAHLNKGKCRYKFVVDGKWILDPANKLWEQNEYGTGNSVLWIEKD
ncbi:MAG TPA: hypothetical protein PKC54_08480 [Ferruginibacter sp.]|nr:hypothetical protein [Ferruginibacter sp.]